MADRYRAGKRLWSAADDIALREIYPDTPTVMIAPLLRRSLYAIYARVHILGLRKSAAYLASPEACRLRRGDHVGAAFRFKKGQTPANKGLRRQGWSSGRMRETQFKKGTRRGVAVALYKPIGSERISKDGYLERKVNDSLPLQARWRAVHLIVWEQAHGPLPPSHAIAFVNRDKRDIRLDNLECITRAELMRRNTIHTLPPALKSTVRLLASVNRQIRKREHADGHQHD